MNGEESSGGRRRIRALDFRKNVQWFLAALVGFLVFVILFLLLFLQGAMAEAALQRRADQTRTVSWLEREIRDLGADISDGQIVASLSTWRSSFEIEAIEIKRSDGSTLRSGTPPPSIDPIDRTLGAQTVSIWFGTDPLEETRSRFTRVAIISIASTLFGTLLLLLFLPRVVGPVETMLRDAEELTERDSSVSDEKFLIETFRSSIAKLRAQESELRDLHERERTRANDLERVSRLLTRSIASGFLSLDADGNVLEMNEPARSLLRIDDIPLPAPMKDVFADGEFSATLLNSFETKKGVARMEIEDAVSRAQIGLTTVPLLNDSNEFVGMLALFTDLSELRGLEARVRDLRVLADLGEVAAGIAHEFRNSLSTILGYLRMALRSDLPEEEERRIRLAESEGQRMAETISSLLNFSRPMEIAGEPLSLNELVKETVRRIDSTRFEISNETEITVNGDSSLLQSLVENLARNALEASENTDSPIRVVIKRENAEAVVEIRDEGSGIPEDLLPRIFLPFQSGKPDGTGLGLAIARKIALSHGGSIELANQKKGATARVTLPIHETAPST